MTQRLGQARRATLVDLVGFVGEEGSVMIWKLLHRAEIVRPLPTLPGAAAPLPLSIRFWRRPVPKGSCRVGHGGAARCMLCSTFQSPKRGEARGRAGLRATTRVGPVMAWYGGAGQGHSRWRAPARVLLEMVLRSPPWSGSSGGGAGFGTGRGKGRSAWFRALSHPALGPCCRLRLS